METRIQNAIEWLVSEGYDRETVTRMLTRLI